MKWYERFVHSLFFYLQMVESCSQIAGACLEQTTWLRRNLAVKEEELTSTPTDSPGKCK